MWQPIETVPDCEPVLVWAPGLHRGRASAEVVVVYREGETNISGWAWWTNGGANGGTDFDADYWHHGWPTHWMPLPHPP